MERMHANLGGKLKFRQQEQNNAEVSSITPEKKNGPMMQKLAQDQKIL